MTVRDLIKETVKLTKQDEQLVQNIILNQFGILIKIMKDNTDVRDILFNKLFKFKLKRRFRENKTQKYTK